MFSTRRTVCVWHYHVQKKRNRQLLQSEIRYEVSVTHLHNFGPSKRHSECYTGPYDHVRLQPIASTHLICKVWDYLACPFLSNIKIRILKNGSASYCTDKGPHKTLNIYKKCNITKENMHVFFIKIK